MFPLAREADDPLDDNVINTHVRNEVCRLVDIRLLPGTCAARCGRSSAESALCLRLQKCVRLTILGGNALQSTAFALPALLNQNGRGLRRCALPCHELMMHVAARSLDQNGVRKKQARPAVSRSPTTLGPSSVRPTLRGILVCLFEACPVRNSTRHSCALLAGWPVSTV